MKLGRDVEERAWSVMGERENVRRGEWTTYRKVLPPDPDPQQTRHSPPKGCVGTTPPCVPSISKNVESETETSAGRCGCAFCHYWNVPPNCGTAGHRREEGRSFFECIDFGFWCMNDQGTWYMVYDCRKVRES